MYPLHLLLCQNIAFLLTLPLVPQFPRLSSPQTLCWLLDYFQQIQSFLEKHFKSRLHHRPVKWLWQSDCWPSWGIASWRNTGTSSSTRTVVSPFSSAVTSLTSFAHLVRHFDPQMLSWSYFHGLLTFSSPILLFAAVSVTYNLKLLT